MSTIFGVQKPECPTCMVLWEVRMFVDMMLLKVEGAPQLPTSLAFQQTSVPVASKNSIPLRAHVVFSLPAHQTPTRFHPPVFFSPAPPVHPGSSPICQPESVVGGAGPRKSGSFPNPVEHLKIPYTCRYLLRRHLHPPNPHQTPPQKVLGGLGIIRLWRRSLIKYVSLVVYLCGEKVGKGFEPSVFGVG